MARHLKFAPLPSSWKVVFIFNVDGENILNDTQQKRALEIHFSLSGEPGPAQSYK
jgi:hypothetical protein